MGRSMNCKFYTSKWVPFQLASFLWLPIFIFVDTNVSLAEEIRFIITDENDKPLPCRIHLRDGANKPVKPDSTLSWNDHFVIDGDARVDVPAGEYMWTIERGPEYSPISGKVNVAAGETLVKQTLKRISNLREEGWYSADLHVHRVVADVELLMQAEDLDFAPVIEWWNRPAKDTKPLETTTVSFDERRIYQRMAGEDEREGGALLYFDLNQPLDLAVQSREVPSPMLFVEEAHERNKNVWIDIEKPFWWDVPTWLATEQMDSIGIANNHMNRSGMYLNEAWGRSRDTERLPNPKGNGFWTQEIYYRIQDCGIRIPPSAGSASGVLKNPVGYNRVYVHLGDTEFTRDKWFAGLKAGRCFVTNGPLLRVQANRTRSGHVLKLKEDSLKIELDIQLVSNDPVPEIEVIHNGQIIQRIEVEPNQTHYNSEFTVREPGWFLLRAITDVDHTFRFASTAPWYIEKSASKPRVSRKAAQFFLEWVNERIERVNQNTEPEQREPVVRWHVKAREFWMQRREMATHE